MEKSKKNYIEKIMAAKAMENMTGRKESSKGASEIK